MKRLGFQFSGLVILLLSIGVLSSCEERPADIDIIREELARLSHQMDSLKNVKTSPDTSVSVQQMALADTLKTDTVIPRKAEVIKTDELPIPEKKKKTETPPPSPSKSNTEEERFYYGSSGKVSLVITPWKDDKRELIFYDPFGNVQFTQEDVRHSYSDISEVKAFHSNGAVEKILVHNNPGASMYWSESEITFGINNDPEWMKVMTYPVQHLEQNLNNHYYWDKKTGTWVKQVAMD